MTRFFIAAVLMISGLLVGCNQLTQYTVSEQEINQALAKQNNFSRDIGVPGLANAHITLRNLTSQIGRSEPDKITLTGNADLDMTSLFGNQKAQIALTMRAHPVFNKEQGAVYLQEMEVTNADVKPEKMQAVLQTITPYLNQALRNYFNQQPAYVLSDDRSKGEALAKKYAQGLEVKPGQIIIPFVN
ncbi:lipoprotein [Shimwellia pseudoproteus]|uniref:lipoprotein n=1 Tax=Shimwellia pseudoproteus TaxID=570012 RepID=UPI0018ECD257|nr:lipoprotein [Shimwellia pseudoproteus]MBJ3815502.1 lipoprotein [Shimwellia pseudoproteus]